MEEVRVERDFQSEINTEKNLFNHFDTKRGVGSTENRHK